MIYPKPDSTYFRGTISTEGPRVRVCWSSVTQSEASIEHSSVSENAGSSLNIAVEGLMRRTEIFIRGGSQYNVDPQHSMILSTGCPKKAYQTWETKKTITAMICRVAGGYGGCCLVLCSRKWPPHPAMFVSCLPSTRVLSRFWMGPFLGFTY